MKWDYREVEINAIRPLSAAASNLIVNHSILNILNILHEELVFLGFALEDNPEALGASLAICRHYLGLLSDPNVSLHAATAGARYAAAIQHEVGEFASTHDLSDSTSGTARTIANIESLLTILNVRTRELTARAHHQARWAEFDVADLQSNFAQVLQAITANSRSRFSIVDRGDLQGPRDYLVELLILPRSGNAIAAPPILVDVMRDLIANARKYTQPGGRIRATLSESSSRLNLTVEDSGRGIPESDLQRVVEFGERGSNVKDVRTMGGGFGLTKAFIVTRDYLGRFWLGSQQGAGTKVRLEIPVP
ncbi:MAG: ATP-binding protein [Verrucomicrobiales bacterium]|nr:ATP-binding protein [Verrucomicrobiales bacterium]